MNPHEIADYCDLDVSSETHPFVEARWVCLHLDRDQPNDIKIKKSCIKRECPYLYRIYLREGESLTDKVKDLFPPRRGMREKIKGTEKYHVVRYDVDIDKASCRCNKGKNPLLSITQDEEADLLQKRKDFIDFREAL